MKQKIYILGLVTTAIIITGALLKINHLPGGAHLLILGMVMLVLAFIPLALRNHYMTEGNKKNPALYIITWLTCFVVFGGMLFKILHWPGAGIALMLAIPFPYVVFLPVFLAVTGKDKNFNIYNTVSVLFLLTGVSVFSALLALNVSKDRIDDSMNMSRNYNRLETVLEEIHSPASQTPVLQKIDDLLKAVDDYQALIFTSVGVSEDQWNNDPWSFPRPEIANIAGTALVIKGKKNTPDTRLQTGLKDLMEELIKNPVYTDLAGKAPEIFDYYEATEDPSGWTKGIFMTSPRVWSVIYLDGLETNLKMIKAGIN